MEQINVRSIFSPATGFIARVGCEWTCNPYVGCTFACSYCYAAFLPQNRRPVEDWGRWIAAKVNAVELARKHGPKLAGKALYLSSVTDPYVPAERSVGLTRGILEALVPHQPRLLVQTRGPLVVRDIDILKRFASLRVNMTIPTDDEEVKAAFEPKASPLERRWRALADLVAEGIPVGVCVTPMLPLRDPAAFVRRIAALGPAVVVAQHFHDAGRRFGADTGERARELLRVRGWTEDDYRACVARMREVMPVYEGEAGFFPPPKLSDPGVAT
jgi:DNA repair photolyase